MNRGALIGLCAIAVLAAAALRWLPRHRAADAPPAVALSTPPGITLQLRTTAGRPRGNGQILYADANGMTLYVRNPDQAPGSAQCQDDCASAWLPALAPPGAASAGDWSVLDRAGSRQWALRGAPLYRFLHDTEVGDSNGEGTGAWRVAAFHPGDGMMLPDAIAVREIDGAGGAGLVDSLGMTLYVFDGEAAAAECAAAGCPHWLPLQAPQIAKPIGDFSVIARNDGISQWAFRGQQLYRFEGDQQPGEVSGVGIDGRAHPALIMRHFMPADAMIRRNPELGDILTTAGGATLYERDRPATDAGHSFRENHGWPALGRMFGTASCDAACARTWPPFIAPSDALPSGYWGIATHSDGKRQWVYKGYALYTHAAEAPGAIDGNLTYDLAPVVEARDTDADARRAASHITRGVDPFVPAGGDVAGIGVGALFWHAVVP